MADNIAFLPAAVGGVIQQGIVAREIRDALKPGLHWRRLLSQVRHQGREGEAVTITRDALIQPTTRTASRLAAGSDPALVTRSVEQFSYKIASQGQSIDIHLPSSFLAQASRFLSDIKRFSYQGLQSHNRFAMRAIMDAYGGGNTFAPNAGVTLTALPVRDATGFESVVVNGIPVPVSSANPGSLSIAGAAAVTYTAVDLTTNTITLSATASWSQYDSIVRSDAARVVRVNDRATQRLVVSGDTATLAAFRKAAAYLRGHNVPGMDGQVDSDYGAFIDSDTEDQLFALTEFRDAVNGAGKSVETASGSIGRYAGIQFFRAAKSEMEILASSTGLQTDIHRSLVFGSEVCVEAYLPETEFAGEVTIGQGIALANHYKMALTDNGVITLVLRAPMDALGRTIRGSWVSNVDYTCPTDSKALTGSQRYKRCVVVESAGPAA